MQSQLLQHNRRGLQLHSARIVGLSPSSDAARENWELGRQLLSHFPSGWGTDVTWLRFLLLGAGTAPPPGMNPSTCCSLGPSHRSQLRLPVQVLLLGHFTSPPGGGRKVMVRKLSYTGSVESHAEGALQTADRGSSALEHI